MRPRPSILDIARRAGVSVGTASNVISGKAKHSEATKQRVLQAAADLHYTTNALVKSLITGRTGTVGIFTWRVPVDGGRSIGISLLHGVSEGLASVDYDTLLYSRHPFESATEPTLFLDGRVDGVIMVPGGLNFDGLSVLENGGIRAVVLYDPDVPPQTGYVAIDNAQGISAVIDHLVGLGHRRIKYAGPDYTHDYRERRKAFHVAMAAHGLASANTDVLTPALHEPTIADTCDRLFDGDHAPTAIVSCDDALAAALITELGGRGLRVPEDVSVTGFDDAFAGFDPLHLTTIRQPAAMLGFRAAEFVVMLLRGAEIEECRTTLPVELIVRGSTARPPNP